MDNCETLFDSTSEKTGIVSARPNPVIMLMMPPAPLKVIASIMNGAMIGAGSRNEYRSANQDRIR
jgi:hypothetical protein